MKIYFDKLYKDDRKKELCGLCVPFEKGLLKASSADALTILDGDRPLPLQAEVTSKWDDGSVRFAYIHFLADLPGNDKKEFELVTDTDKKGDYTKTIDIDKTADGIKVNNGLINFFVRDNSEDLFEEFDYCDRSFDKKQFVGPFVTVSGERLRTTFDN